MAKKGSAAAEEDLSYVEIFATAIRDAASATGMRACVLAGIVSRETRGRKRFFTGDNGHGHGPMQIDDRYHPGICELYTSGQIDDERMVMEGAGILAGMFDQLADLDVKARERGAIAAYNCGVAGLRQSLREGFGADGRTTGKDYSADVLERAAYFEEHGFSDVDDVCEAE